MERKEEWIWRRGEIWESWGGVEEEETALGMHKEKEKERKKGRKHPVGSGTIRGRGLVEVGVVC